jgi:hypothetical protein
MSVSRCRRDAQSSGGLVESEAGKIPQLDEVSRDLVKGR